jgi:hypothetical protein
VHLVTNHTSYGRGAGVGCGRGVGANLGVGVGLGVAVGVAVGVGVEVFTVMVTGLEGIPFATTSRELLPVSAVAGTSKFVETFAAPVATPIVLWSCVRA